MRKDHIEALNTPAMRQYLEIKNRHPDSILFFRMGDFYEMFMEDAIIASSILDIALTKRQNQIPMCGIPYHATESYVSRLISAGKTVVICEQIKNEDNTTKLLQREVVRVISPGTVVEENLIGGYENNFLCFVYFHDSSIFLVLADITTSEIYYFKFDRSESEKLATTLEKFKPREILVYKEHALSWGNLQISSQGVLTLLDSAQIPIPNSGDFSFLKEVIDKVLNRSFKDNSFQFLKPEIINDNAYLQFDFNTIRNLELIENQNPSEKEHTLFQTLNKCLTGAGKRLLKKKILFPLKNPKDIISVWEKINILSSDKKLTGTIQGNLLETSDLERILARFRAGKALPRDFRTLLRNLDIARSLHDILSKINYPFPEISSNLHSVYSFIFDRLSSGELPPILGSEGEFIKKGFSEKLDEARLAKSRGKDWILDLEEKERVRSGFNTLKIKFNKVVGYFIELSRKEAKTVPSYFIKKQTLVTSERFTIPDLEELERTILHADEIIQDFEKVEFDNMVKKSLSAFEDFLLLAQSFSELDYHLSLSICKDEYGWVQPEINDNGNLLLEDSRHPVVEKFLKTGDRFVKNSVFLNCSQESIAILTGPNMAGKSTFMRQIAISQILFQMGSFVPAKKASFSIVDNLFTRIGSGDNLTAGESTFFLEMKESASILNNRSQNSLILFDEIGRGTSTYDGLSLAWAIVEHLSRVSFDGKRTKTIFATHYHELTDLEKENGVFNLYMDTVEKEGEIIFLRKVRKGKAKKSFGIYVAKLAGIPFSIVERASEILLSLESKKKEIKLKQEEDRFLFPIQTAFPPEYEKIKSILQQTDIDSISPRDALDILYELKKLF